MGKEEFARLTKDGSKFRRPGIFLEYLGRLIVYQSPSQNFSEYFPMTAQQHGGLSTSPKICLRCEKWPKSGAKPR
jgi:hypothetical protein